MPDDNEKRDIQSDWKNPSGDEIRAILTGAKTIAVVGLSAKENRTSNGVARYLIEKGYDVIPVNPMETTILGRKSFPDLGSIDKAIDIVDIFRKSEAALAIVKEAIGIGAKNIWLQEGVISEDSFLISTEAEIPIIMDRCILKEHTKLGNTNGND